MKKLYILLLLNLSILSLFAQQTAMPKECINPPAGYILGGGFRTDSPFVCSGGQYYDQKVRAINVFKFDASKLSYNFNYKGGAIKTNNNSIVDTIYTNEGVYWILQVGLTNTNIKTISCVSVEIIKTYIPEAEEINCENKIKVIIKDTLFNKKNDEFQINWGDDSISVVSAKILPLTIVYNYTKAIKKNIDIVGYVLRNEDGNIRGVCGNHAKVINKKEKNDFKLIKLKGLNEGKEANITFIKGQDNKEYIIQFKSNDTNVWTDATIKIKRTANETKGEANISGLKPANQYCFRLKTIDNCGEDVLSNELCTISLSSKTLSDNEVRLDWNNLENNKFNKYIVSGREGEESFKYFINSQKNTTFTYQFLHCNKKYYFSVSAELFSSQIYPTEDSITVISPEILIIPTYEKVIAAPDNIATVSVNTDTKTLKYNIFEPSGYAKYKYLFYRSINGGNFEKVGESINNVYDDKNVDLEKNYYCYAYKYESECGAQSALSINKPCNIKLSIENTTLKWTPFILENSTNKAGYIVELLDNDGAVVNAIIITSETSHDAKSTIDFQQSGSNKTPKFRVLGRINYNINSNGTLIPFPFSVYSNIITYSPILSTANESEILNIYPNPSEEIIQFNSTFLLKTAEIVNLQGKVVENQAIEDNQVSVKNLPKGKYILRLYNQEKKLVVNKTIVKM